jgi:hypothetical protein
MTPFPKQNLIYFLRRLFVNSSMFDETSIGKKHMSRSIDG